MKETEMLANLSNLFPSVDKAFIEDVWGSSNKDFDKTVDQLLSMGCELAVAKQEKHAPPHSQYPSPTPSQYSSPAPSQYPSPPPPSKHPAPVPLPHTSLVHQSPYPLNSSPNPALTPPLTPSHYPPLNSTPLSPTPSAPLTNSVTYPTVPNMFNVPATPPPINTGNNKPPPITPTAPPSKPADGSMETKRLETLRQELALEYQRINDKHKSNIEEEQKLEQARDYTNAELRKLDEQRAQLQEDKRKFSEELTTRFTALQEEQIRQREQFRKMEEDRQEALAAEAERRRQEKEMKRNEKAMRKLALDKEKEENEQQKQREFEDEKQGLVRRLQMEAEEMKAMYEDRLREKDGDLNKLHDIIGDLQRQLDESTVVAHAAIAEVFTAVGAAFFDGVHASSTAQIEGNTSQQKVNNYLNISLGTLVQSIQRRQATKAEREKENN